MTACAAVVRVSMERQCPKAQRTAIEEFAAREGLTIDRWFDEGCVSGALEEDERPKLAELMQAIRAGEIGTLLIAEWSRLGRTTITQLQRALEIQKAGVRVLALDDARKYDLDDPDDLLLFFLIVWKDHRQRIDTKLRTKRAFVRNGDGVTVSRRNGKRSGRPPLILDAQALAEFRAAVAAKHSLTEIASRGLVTVPRGHTRVPIRSRGTLAARRGELAG